MKIISILSAPAVLALAACSTLRTTADYDRSADFSKYHIFAVQVVPHMRLSHDRTGAC